MKTHNKKMQRMLSSNELTEVAVAMAASWDIKGLPKSTPDLCRSTTSTWEQHGNSLDLETAET
jgi:hypothetical protein